MMSQVQTFQRITSGGIEEIMDSRPFGIQVRPPKTQPTRRRHGPSTFLNKPLLFFLLLFA